MQTTPELVEIISETRAKIIGVVNQKGGVGKTTTSINLGAYLAASGRKVLLIDLDPQANATSGVGARDAKVGVYEAMANPEQVADYIVSTPQEGLDVLPATADLAGAAIELGEDPYVLRHLLSHVHGYDLLLIDAPPSLGPLTINVLTAADALLIPLQAEYYALEGVAGLLETVERVRGKLNPSLQVLGMVITMFDSRTNLAQQVEENVRAHFGELVFWSVVPRNVRLAEAPSYAKPINHYSPMSNGANAYRRLADEVMQRVQKI